MRRWFLDHFDGLGWLAKAAVAVAIGAGVALLLAAGEAAERERAVANARSMRFHRPTCPAAERIHPANIRRFRTHADARAAGYRPCRACDPDGDRMPKDPDFIDVSHDSSSPIPHAGGGPPAGPRHRSLPQH
ncbi:MAG: hypothetical protein GX591_11955 [Planctomycetes bacterium]|nr:hypothetical protein [Planctomycetota bacterium]